MTGIDAMKEWTNQSASHFYEKKNIDQRRKSSETSCMIGVDRHHNN